MMYEEKKMGKKKRIKKDKEQSAFALIKEIYFQIDNNIDSLLEACNNDEEKKQLKHDLLIARANYRKSLNISFDQNDPVIKDMTKKLCEIEKRIKKDMEGLEIASNVFMMISEAVKIANSITSVVIGLM